MVKPDDLDDIKAASLARDIAKKVEEDLVFPGQIKVTVIREDAQCGVCQVGIGRPVGCGLAPSAG